VIDSKEPGKRGHHPDDLTCGRTVTIWIHHLIHQSGDGIP